MALMLALLLLSPSSCFLGLQGLTVWTAAEEVFVPVTLGMGTKELDVFRALDGSRLPGEVRGAGFLGVPASLTFGERLHPLPLVTLPHRA